MALSAASSNSPCGLRGDDEGIAHGPCCRDGELDLHPTFDPVPLCMRRVLRLHAHERQHIAVDPYDVPAVAGADGAATIVANQPCAAARSSGGPGGSEVCAVRPPAVGTVGGGGRSIFGSRLSTSGVSMILFVKSMTIVFDRLADVQRHVDELIQGHEHGRAEQHPPTTANGTRRFDMTVSFSLE